jgi:hypothetical protein
MLELPVLVTGIYSYNDICPIPRVQFKPPESKKERKYSDPTKTSLEKKIASYLQGCILQTKGTIFS